MARGKKTKSAELHKLKGSYRKDRHDARQAPMPAIRHALELFDKPDFLKGRAAELWDEMLPEMRWLFKIDRAVFSMWCALQAEFEDGPGGMTAARLTQLRLVAESLGLTRNSRALIGVPDPDGPSSPEGLDHYFDDGPGAGKYFD